MAFNWSVARYRYGSDSAVFTLRMRIFRVVASDQSSIHPSEIQAAVSREVTAELQRKGFVDSMVEILMVFIKT